MQQKSTVLKNGERNQRSCAVEAEPRNSLLRGYDDFHAKRRKTSDARSWEIESEQEEHSLSLSQHSSPSQSDHEQNTVPKLPSSASESILPSQQLVRIKLHHQKEHANGIQKTNQDLNYMDGESPRHPKTEQFLRVLPPAKHEVQFLTADQKPLLRPALLPIIGAEVRGTVDGAFDSGYLVTANVNGQVFRGVLFAPGPGIAVARPALHLQNLTSAASVSQQCSPHAIPTHVRPPTQPTAFILPECSHHARQSHPVQVVKGQPARLNSDLKGVVLSLGGPGGGSGS